MILLLLGWNLTLAGLVLLLYNFLETDRVLPVCGITFTAAGLALSIIFRKACSSYKSDPIEKSKKEKPLDYY